MAVGSFLKRAPCCFRPQQDDAVRAVPEEPAGPDIPRQESLPFLRLTSVLLHISSRVYEVTDNDINVTEEVSVLLAGAADGEATLRMTLVDFQGAAVASKENELSSPQQFGVWEVEGVGLVLAFRGTASFTDVAIDVNFKPVVLEGIDEHHGTVQIMVHNGFYRGAVSQQSRISEILSARMATSSPYSPSADVIDDGSSSQDTGRPLYVTGHSLGGGYANCFMLGALTQQAGFKHFAYGGGCITFGAPMVLYSENKTQLYKDLRKLEQAAEAAATKAGHPVLHFHNFVNGYDIVPRLLGLALDNVKDLFFTDQTTSDSKEPQPKPTTTDVNLTWTDVQKLDHVLESFHPFGTYHFIRDNEVLTPKHTDPASSMGSLGDEQYAENVQEALKLPATFKAVRNSPLHHLLNNYDAGLQAHMKKVARSLQPAAAEDADNLSSLFTLLR